MEELIITAVKPYEVLYDSKHTDYMKIKVKNAIWSKISKDLNMTNGNEAKVIWTKLRNRHRECLRRQRRCLKRGAPAGKQWRYQKEMTFLLPYMSTALQEGEELEETQSDYPDTVVFTNLESEESDQEQERIIEDPLQQEQEMKVDVNSLVMESLTHTEQKEMRTSERTNDPLYHFFMSMYQSTQKMPPESQHLVRTKVFEVISRAEGSLLNIPMPEQEQTENGSTYSPLRL